MKAIIISTYGTPEVLTVTDLPDPVPGDLAGQVLSLGVKVDGVSIDPSIRARMPGRLSASITL